MSELRGFPRNSPRIMESRALMFTAGLVHQAVQMVASHELTLIFEPLCVVAHLQNSHHIFGSASSRRSTTHQALTPGSDSTRSNAPTRASGSTPRISTATSCPGVADETTFRSTSSAATTAGTDDAVETKRTRLPANNDAPSTRPVSTIARPGMEKMSVTCRANMAAI